MIKSFLLFIGLSLFMGLKLSAQTSDVKQKPDLPSSETVKIVKDTVVEINIETVQETPSQFVWYKTESGAMITFGYDTPVDFPQWERTGDLKTDEENYRIAKEKYQSQSKGNKN